jgi:hypothetical protein
MVIMIVYNNLFSTNNNDHLFFECYKIALFLNQIFREEIVQITKI